MSQHCPRCSVPLSHNRVKGVINWQCSQCHGVFVNLAVLRKMTKPAVADKFWRIAAKEGTPSTSNCPSCRGGMLKARVATGGATITLDLCLRCQAAWFDHQTIQGLGVQLRERPEVLEAQRAMAIFDAQQMGELHTYEKNVDMVCHAISIFGDDIIDY